MKTSMFAAVSLLGICACSVLLFVFFFFMPHLKIVNNKAEVNIQTMVLGEYESNVREFLILDVVSQNTVVRLVQKKDNFGMWGIWLNNSTKKLDLSLIDENYLIEFPQSKENEEYTFVKEKEYLVKACWKYRCEQKSFKF